MTTIASIILAAAFNLHTDRVGTFVTLPDWAPIGQIDDRHIAGNAEFNNRFSTNSYAGVASLIDGLYERRFIGRDMLDVTVYDIPDPTGSDGRLLWDLPRNEWTNFYASSSSDFDDPFAGGSSGPVLRRLPDAQKLIHSVPVHSAMAETRRQILGFSSGHLDDILGRPRLGCVIPFAPTSWQTKPLFTIGSQKQWSGVLAGFCDLKRDEIYNGPIDKPYDHSLILGLIYENLPNDRFCKDEDREAYDEFTDTLKKTPATSLTSDLQPAVSDVVLDGIGRWKPESGIDIKGGSILCSVTNETRRTLIEPLAIANRNVGEMESVYFYDGSNDRLRFADVAFSIGRSGGTTTHAPMTVNLTGLERQDMSLTVAVNDEDIIKNSSMSVTALTNAYTFTDACSFHPFARTPGCVKSGYVNVQAESSVTVDRRWHDGILEMISGDLDCGELPSSQLTLIVRLDNANPEKDGKLGYNSTLVAANLLADDGIHNTGESVPTKYITRRHVINGPVTFDTTRVTAHASRDYKAQFSLYEVLPKIDTLPYFGRGEANLYVESIAMIAAMLKMSMKGVKGEWFDGGDPVKDEFMPTIDDDEAVALFRISDTLNGLPTIKSRQDVITKISKHLFDSADEARKFTGQDIASPIEFSESSDSDLSWVLSEAGREYTGDFRLSINGEAYALYLAYKMHARIVEGRLLIESIDGFRSLGETLGDPLITGYGPIPSSMVIGSISMDASSKRVSTAPAKAYTCDITSSRMCRRNYRFGNLEPKEKQEDK